MKRKQRKGKVERKDARKGHKKEGKMGRKWSKGKSMFSEMTTNKKIMWWVLGGESWTAWKQIITTSKWTKGGNELFTNGDERKDEPGSRGRKWEKLHTGRRWMGPESRAKVPEGGSPERGEAEQLPTAPPNDSRPLPPSSRAINPHSQRAGKSAGTQLGAGQAAGCQPAGADLDAAAEGFASLHWSFFPQMGLKQKPLPVTKTSEGKDGSRGV